MTPEQLVERLQQALPTGLRSVVLYGSAAAGDHIAGTSDYNVLVVADRWGRAELDALSATATVWAKAGNRPPLLFTPRQLAASLDAFPIELADILQSHRILFGSNPLVGIRIDPAHLRLELERDWKVRLLQLRERYLLTQGKAARVVELLTASLSTILVLCRATLRLYRPDVPSNKLEALRLLAQQIGFDPQAFVRIHDIRARGLKPREPEALALFDDYVKAVEQIVEAINHLAHPPG